MTFQRPVLILVTWGLMLVLAGWYASNRMVVDNNLTSFLPAPATAPQRVVWQEFREGAGSRVWIIGLRSISEIPDTAGLAEVSRRLAEHLRTSGHFSQVHNGAVTMDQDLGDLLFRYRYLLADHAGSFEAVALESAFHERLIELSMPYAPFKEGLIASDPTDAYLGLLESLAELSSGGGLSSSAGVWIAGDGRTAVLLADSRHSGMDHTAQALALASIEGGLAFPEFENAFEKVLSGAPYIALQVRDETQETSVRLSLVATLLLVSLTAWVYRSMAAVVMIAVPLGTALLLASVVTALLYGSLHVLTVAFGVTLLGVSMDYPVHVLSHRRAQERLESTVRRIWPVLRIGVVTTILGFSAMIWTDFPGIAQLGVFSVIGLACAGLTTRFVLPAIAAGSDHPGPRGFAKWVMDRESLRRRRGAIAGLLSGLTLAGLAYLATADVWHDDIGGLSPTPRSLIVQDQRIRQQFGLAEPGSLLVVRAASQEQVLQKQENLQAVLQQAIDQGILSGYRMASQWFPSQATQERRRAELPSDAVLSQRIRGAAAASGFAEGVFEQFRADVEQSRKLPLLTPPALRGTNISGYLDSLLFDFEGGGAGLVRLLGVQEYPALREILSASGLKDVWLLEAREEINRAVQQFRQELLSRLAIITVVVLGVMFVMLKDPRRVAKIALTVAASAVLALVFSGLVFGSLNVISLISVMLIAGIGVDYALFFTQPCEAEGDRLATVHALMVCALSSLFVFVLLGVSGINVLQSIGVPVSAGVVMSFMISLVLAGPVLGRNHV